jgi:hypothetical protein
MMKTQAWAFVCLALCVSWARAEGETAADYSHSLPLSVSGKQGVVGFTLPQSVYLHARTADLADLRLFDADGAQAPFALHRPSPQTRTRRESWPVKRFPLMAGKDPAQSVDGIRLDIKTGADGTLLSVKTKPTRQSQTSGQTLAGLVLDVGKPGDAALPLIGALSFTLPPTRQTYSAQVWLEVSGDLTHWETIGAAELSWLVGEPSAAGSPEILANDRLEFAPRRFRYARLSWRGGEPLDFAKITAESVEQTADAPALEKLALPAAPGRKPEDLAYRAGVAIPAESVELRFSEPNIVLPAEIGRYRELPARSPGQPGAWVFEPLTRNVFYQITQDGKLRRSGAWPVPVSHYAEWVVRAQSPGTARPELILAWQPATLVLLAAGHPPYTLAFGREDAKPAYTRLEQVAPGFSAQELARLEQAQAGPLQTRPGLEPPAHSAAQDAAAAAQRRTLVLWAVLLAGVAALAGMLWRLFRQMR